MECRPPRIEDRTLKPTDASVHWAVAAGWLLLAIALALTARCLNAPVVFVDGEVYFAMWDGSYHARRALYSFLEFPRILWFDPYIAYPDGASVPMPPLYDWTLAAVARLFGDDVPTFERVAAWSSPVIAALTLLPVYAIGRRLDRDAAGIGAALLLALLPASAMVTQLGDPDHHAAVALLVTLYAGCGAYAVHSGTRGSRRVLATALLTAVRVALLLSWSGSLLYLAVGEGALLLASLLAKRPGVFAAQSLGALSSALLVTPWVAVAGTPIGGPFSATTLSWLHPTALLAVSCVTACLAALEHRHPTASAPHCATRAALLVTLLAGALLAIPQIRDSLLPGLTFLSRGNTWSELINEQRPLYAWMSDSARGRPTNLFGGFAYLIPLAPLGYLWRARTRSDREPQLLLAVWTAALGALTILQIRFGGDFAPLGCLGFALLLDTLRRTLRSPLPRFAALATVGALAIGLSWPAWSDSYRTRGQELIAHLARSERFQDPVFLSGGPSLVRFSKLVSRVTPETAGFLDPTRKPEYGVLVKPTFGHAIHYAGRRATSADGFGPYLDAEKMRLVQRFYTARGEREATRIAERLEARYVVSFDNHTLRDGQFFHLLHRLDGSRRDGSAHLEHFRLIAEAPLGARPLRTLFPRGSKGPVIPYKLFERVEGAVLTAAAPPGTVLGIELQLRTNTGRSFRFTAGAEADSDGTVRIRVPYSTEDTGPTRALGPYRIRLGERAFDVSLSEADVRGGRIIALAGTEE